LSGAVLLCVSWQNVDGRDVGWCLFTAALEWIGRSSRRHIGERSTAKTIDHARKHFQIASITGRARPPPSRRVAVPTSCAHTAGFDAGTRMHVRTGGKTVRFPFWPTASPAFLRAVFWIGGIRDPARVDPARATRLWRCAHRHVACLGGLLARNVLFFAEA